MAVKWNYFAAASGLTWCLLIPAGAPWLPVVLGTAGVGVFNWLQLRKKLN